MTGLETREALSRIALEYADRFDAPMAALDTDAKRTLKNTAMYRVIEAILEKWAGISRTGGQPDSASVHIVCDVLF